MKVRHSAAIYFAVQSIAVIAWWATLYLYPSARKYFQLEQYSETSLLAFWLADLAFISAGSFVTAWLCATDSPLKTIPAWFVTGCVSYAAVYTFVFASMADAGWLGVVLMFPAMIWSGVFSVGMSFGNAMFRPAAAASPNWIVVKTLLQILIVWSVILVVIPYLVTIAEDKVGITRLTLPFQRTVAAAIFIAISSLGVYAAYVMSRVGQGTPLPFDHAKNLVIAGPYRYVRNPMAVSGIGQGLAVALFLGSPLVVLYALMGSLIWQLIFRPLEEEDLERRFGEEYRTYRENVRCWIPRMTAFRKPNAD